jgi:hypothetical protein
MVSNTSGAGARTTVEYERVRTASFRGTILVVGPIAGGQAVVSDMLE